MDRERELRLDLLAGGRKAAPGDGCPSPTELAELAAGIAAEPAAERLLAHAAQCDACGPILHGLIEDFHPAPDVAEPSPAAADEWQRQTAAKMAESAGRGRVVVMPARRWLVRAAAVMAVLGGGYMAWQTWVVSDASPLIAEAYVQQRPFEFRIPETGHADVRVERGGTSSFQRPPALLEAEAKIARELAKQPDSVKWLDQRARAEMLGWDPTAAIATLQRALDRKPDDPDLTADLGMAYALRAEVDKRDLDYAYAIDYLGRSLKARPNSPATIFNRAIVYERMHLVDEAMREWRRYLEMDPRGAWHDEAQRRLEQLDSKKNSGRLP